MSQLPTSPRHHVEVLTKLKQLRVFVWLKEGSESRIGCKKDPSNGDLLVVLVAQDSRSFEVVRVPVMTGIEVDIASAQLSAKEGIATCIFVFQFEADNSTYMWSHSPLSIESLSASSLSKLSCRLCDQLLLKQPSQIEQYVSSTEI